MALTPSTTDELLVEQHDRVVLITLNRPDRFNAISRDMLDELSKKVVEANKDPDIRCIVLTGAGKGFCAGGDVKDMAARGFAFGLASHGIGTARAMSKNKKAGVFAAVAMGLSGIITALLIPVIFLVIKYLIWPS